MSEFASNCPISRPVNFTSIYDPTVDFNGVMWSPKIGFLYAVQDELLPIRLPSPYLPEG